ncbi:putative O-glycosylation ligase, exosortase A system-associated [Sphingosinicella rhizophila]|uniref:O-glycosylation ligase, exosortase A system-associated n=1 Tax=Sphingosinicella rhizophila TaxID=3050082 RepID=A0ABU3Q863_9SPHN|nr:putative O-glycosylation ligase, exosortase A system-associated [Sphingosinicella sp. GR2756]MDT9599158.1 putative O-glycosylation ligase, exosortase A system-associated [Sphingosinicella sp. GR2756]
MRDLVFIAYIMALLGFGLKRPFIFVLTYAYIDIVSPQHLSYYLLNSIPLSMIVASLAIAGWMIADDKKGLSVTPRQGLMLMLLAYAGYTTLHADFPVEALEKWAWVWKAMIWAIFLPFTLRTRLRIEAYLLFMTLSAAAIIIVGGIKTAASGGGYGALNLMVSSNSGLYEGSTISTVAIALVPVILWLARFSTIYPRDWRVRIFAYNLVFACLLIPIGTEARTGLVCIAVLVVLMLRDVKRRLLYLGLIGLAGLAAIPMLPSSFSTRMETISTYQADGSAASRLAVWGWTWDYVKDHPLGGGFEAYRQNSLLVKTVSANADGPVQIVDSQVSVDKGRAYHSSYFEMLGEQGFPGLILFLLIHGIGLIRMEVLRRRHIKADGDKAWIAPLATALQSAQIIYLVGSLFVGIAFQPFVYMLLAVQIAFDTHVTRKDKAEARKPFRAAKAEPLAVKAG